MTPTRTPIPPASGHTTRQRQRRCKVGWLSLLLIQALIAHDVQAREIKLREEPVVVLARSMESADELARWDFADTLLDALIDTYQEELASALDEDITTPARKAKLARWQAATALLMEELVDARLLLSEGAPFEIQVDATDQVLLFVDQKPIAFSAPRPGTEAMMNRHAVRDYCSRNDCTVVSHQDRRPQPDTVRAGGNWLLRQGHPPAYEVGSTLRCTFPDIGRREQKAQACALAAADLEDLLEAANIAARRGHGVDWTRLAERRQTTGMEIAVPLVESGQFIRLTLRLITRLDDEAWFDLVSRLRVSPASATRVPVAVNGMNLLAAFAP